MSGDTLRLAVIVEAATAAAVKALNDVEKAEKGVAAAGNQAGSSASSASEKIDKVGHSSSGVRRELIVLFHEMSQGNYTRFSGSLLVIGERLDAMKYLMSPLGVGLSAVAVAVGSLVYAMIKGSSESTAFRNNIKLTGDYAGVTEGQFNSLVNTVAAGDGKFAQSRDILQQLVGTGRFTAESIGGVGLAASKLRDVSKEDSEKIVEDFAKMTDGVAKWAAEHNRSYHFITGDQYEQIRSLEQQGDVQKAVLVTAQALYAHLGGPAVQNLGTLEKAWRAVGNGFSAFWEELKSFGRDTTVDDRIAELTAKLQQMRTVASGRGGTRTLTDEEASAANTTHSRAGSTDMYKSAQAELAKLQEQQRRERQAAQAKSADDQLQQTKIEFEQLLQTTRDAHQKMLDEVAAYKSKYQGLVGKAGGITQADYDAGLSALTQKESDAIATAHAGMITSIAQADAALAKSEAGRAKTQLDEQLKANAISIQQYYAQRQAIEDQALAAERRSHATELAATQKLPARDEAQAETRKGKEYQLESQLKDLDQQRLALARQMTAEREQALKALDKEIGAAIAAGGRRNTLDTSAEKDALERQYNDLIDKARQSRPDQVPALVQALGLREAQVDLDAIGRKMQNLLADLQGKQVTVQAQVETGQISPEAGRADLKKATADALQQLKAARDELTQKLQDAASKGLDTSSIVRSLDDVQKKITELSDSPMKKLLRGWSDTTGAMEVATTHWMDGAADALTSFDTTGNANFRDFTVSILKDLAEIEIKALAAQVILGSAGSGGGLGIFGALLGAFVGSAGGGAAAGAGAGASAGSSGVMIAAAGGGRVSGPGTRTSDSIRAWLSDGEFVVKADAVARPGVLPLLNAINGDHLTRVRSVRLASGGMVGTSPAAGGSAAASSLVVPISMPIQLGDNSGLTAADGAALQKKMAPQMQQFARATMLSEMRPGGILQKLSPA